MKRLPVSFEFFPYKTPEGKRNLSEAAALLTAYQPHFFSVTFGAFGSTRDGTVETMEMLQKNASINMAPHLSCIGLKRAEIVEMLQRYQALGVKRIVALRGDVPKGIVGSGEFKFASELVALIRETTGDYFHIDVAAYPEIHPQAACATDDVLNLQRKLQAGANGAITQYFFNPDAYFYYLDECAKLNITLPVIPGIMPITQHSKLVHFSDVCGAEIPRWILKRLESYGEDSESMQQFGTEVVVHLCERLIAGGAPGLHFYTLNKAEATVKVLAQLGFALPKVVELA